MNQLGELAYQIWDVEFGSHSTEEERTASAIGISGYLDANLGQLNTLINTDFKVDETVDEVSPAFKYEEKAIFSQLYLKDYLKKEARNTLKNATSTPTSTEWMELREGDSAIKRAIATPTSKNNSAQILQKAANEANETLNELVHSYNMYGSIPVQVAGLDGGSTESTS
jgi:hypothetical protein